MGLRTVQIAVVIALSVGCRNYVRHRNPPDDTGPTQPLDTATEPSVTDTATEPTPPDTGPTTTPYDCTLPPSPTTWDFLDWVPPSEEFQFDTNGSLINIDEVAGWIFETPWGGPANLIAPYSATEIAGIGFMLDGDLAVADEANGALRRVGMDGTQSTLLGGLDNPNSLVIHIDGFIFTTSFDEVLRVDPNSGANTRVFRIPNADLDGLVFSPDFTRLYLNSDETGQVFSAEIDASGALTDIKNIATVALGWDDQLDGAAMDVCGNLYVIRTDGRLFRVRSDWTVESLIQLTRPGALKTTSLHFGSGFGGWELDHLYVMDREGGMYDLDMGIDGAPPAHLFP